MAFDPDFGKTGFARRLFRLRFRELKLSQRAFAERFGLTLGAIKDAEQGRVQPLPAMRVLVACIEADPKLVQKAAWTAHCDEDGGAERTWTPGA
jgi:hypothetical protein